MHGCQWPKAVESCSQSCRKLQLSTSVDPFYISLSLRRGGCRGIQLYSGLQGIQVYRYTAVYSLQRYALPLRMVSGEGRGWKGSRAGTGTEAEARGGAGWRGGGGEGGWYGGGGRQVARLHTREGDGRAFKRARSRDPSPKGRRIVTKPQATRGSRNSGFGKRGDGLKGVILRSF